jgi:hypothetical protein
MPLQRSYSRLDVLPSLKDRDSSVGRVRATLLFLVQATPRQQATPTIFRISPCAKSCAKQGGDRG